MGIGTLYLTFDWGVLFWAKLRDLLRKLNRRYTHNNSNLTLVAQTPVISRMDCHRRAQSFGSTLHTLYPSHTAQPEIS